MKKSKFSTYFIFVSVFTFITVFLSMVQKSYFSLVKPQQVVENNDLLKEINPNIDLSILSTIESKDKNIDENFDYSTINKPSNVIPITTPTISLQPEATSGSSLE